jgi:hypothetical protein
MSTVDVVITRYNEFINWIDYLPDNVRNIYVYNKGFNDQLFKNHESRYSEKIIIKNVENLGKNEHTILYHIINNKDSLADTNVFLPGSIMMNPLKGKFLGNIIKNIPFVNGKYSGFYSPRFKKVKKNYNFSIKENQVEPVKRNFNGLESIKSGFTDFKTFKETLIDDKPLKYMCYRSQFIVSKENILQVDLSIFEKLLSLLQSENCDDCYYIERIWAHLFKRKD